MQTRATLALLSSMHMDYLQIEKYRLLCSYGAIFFSSFPPEMSLPQSAIQHSATQGSPYILQKWPGQLKLR